MRNFQEILRKARIECEGRKEYVIAVDEEDFYFRFDFETEEIGVCSSHELTQDQKEALIDRIHEEFKEEIDQEDYFPVVDHYREYGVNQQMFI